MMKMDGLCPFSFYFEKILSTFFKMRKNCLCIYFSLFFFILSSVTISYYLCTVILHALVCIQISHYFLDLFFFFFLERTLKILNFSWKIFWAWTWGSIVSVTKCRVFTARSFYSTNSDLSTKSWWVLLYSTSCFFSYFGFSFVVALFFGFFFESARSLKHLENAARLFYFIWFYFASCAALRHSKFVSVEASVMARSR